MLEIDKHLRYLQDFLYYGWDTGIRWGNCGREMGFLNVHKVRVVSFDDAKGEFEYTGELVLRLKKLRTSTASEMDARGYGGMDLFLGVIGCDNLMGKERCRRNGDRRERNPACFQYRYWHRTN
ncbi:hypothetical protein DSO57_1036713 [Entomophthora muscae]|uniref:Uncharacterized protein n=1 Tax=Entomophthora muscae TaxID=34485 RepID=A0ACC2U8Y9_9FUNG|nr:hypothetical protein DSO57_1036713 [Entomophthora muscae]